MKMFLSIVFVIQFSLLPLTTAARPHFPIFIGNCMYQYKNQTFNEGETIRTAHKIYKIEQCRLERAYQTCNKTLWHMLYVVCTAINKKNKPISSQRYKRSPQGKLLTEACCEQACTVSSISGFCFNW